MKGEIKEIEVDGRKFELIKKGISESLVIQAMFIRLLIKSGSMNPDMDDDKLEWALAAGLDTSTVIEVKNIIMSCVHAPKITEDGYEDLGIKAIPALFLKIYLFNVGDSEKKSDEQQDSEKS